ncbi:MAG: 23S rRNA (pseudouridine(1915)-N(3))-methyltransferase RlmH [Clostridia bacterium]|nr:23S rRNA (pseudouridine(1915)-N(3))-methyltransferase RlmH [Clostridia bacterium]
MLKITLITVGRLKEQYLRDAVKEYEKRLSTLCTLKNIEIDAAKLPDSPNESQISQALETEAEKILTAIPNGAYIMPMCIEGKQMDSEELSRKLSDIGVSGQSNVVFIIGGSYGLSDRVKQKADYKLSMSKMTFPHQLARVMLLEQIYRAFKIAQGETYHK